MREHEYDYIVDPDHKEGVPCPDTFVLGSGFSYAYSDSMPMTDALGAKCLEDAGLQQDDIRIPQDIGEPRKFEAWLSFLGNDQPYLSTSDNLSNRALFVSVVEMIQRVFRGCEYDSLFFVGRVDGSNKWYDTFVTLANILRPTVITFNYDNLVERLALGNRCYSWVADRFVNRGDLLGYQPPISAGQRSLYEPDEYVEAYPATFRLLKLHGSLDWFSLPEDHTGSSLTRLYLDKHPFLFQEYECPSCDTPLDNCPHGSGRPGCDEVLSRDEKLRIQYAPGRAPFIVPPASGKSRHYTNPLVQELWRQAFDILHHSERIFLLGYSLPTTDTVTGEMLAAAVRDTRAAIKIVILTRDR